MVFIMRTDSRVVSITPADSTQGLCRDLLLLLCAVAGTSCPLAGVEHLQLRFRSICKKSIMAVMALERIAQLVAKKSEKTVFARLASSLIRFASAGGREPNFYYDLPGPAEPSDAVRVSSMVQAPNPHASQQQIKKRNHPRNPKDRPIQQNKKKPPYQPNV